jgi:hypothetical protein
MVTLDPYNLRHTVVASDSAFLEIAEATNNDTIHVCDGTADNVQIQEAIDALPSVGGIVSLSEGIFNIASTIQIPEDKFVWLCGAGHGSQHQDEGTTLKRAADVDVIEYHNTLAPEDCSGFMLSDFRINGDYESGFTGRGIYLHGDDQNTRPIGFRLANLDVFNCGPSALGVTHDGAGSCLVMTDVGHHEMVDCYFSRCWDDIAIIEDAHDFVWRGVLCDAVRDTTNPQAKDGFRFTGTCFGQIIGGHFDAGNLVTGSSAGRYGIYIADGPRLLIVGCIIMGSSVGGIGIEDNDDGIIVANNLFHNHNSSNTANAAHVNLLGTTQNAVVLGNQFRNASADHFAKHGVYEGDSANNNIITNNMIIVGATGESYTSGVRRGGAASIIRDNRGHVTEASGTATINNGATTAVVTHGLGVTPTLAKIQLTMLEKPTNSPRMVWPSTATSTQFTINCDSDPGASNLDVGWCYND